MAKEQFQRTKPHVNGTIGHVDHGKTTLTCNSPRTGEQRFGRSKIVCRYSKGTVRDASKIVTIAV